MKFLTLLFSLLIAHFLIEKLDKPEMTGDISLIVLDSTVIAEINMTEVQVTDILDFIQNVCRKYYRPPNYDGNYPFRYSYAKRKGAAVLSFSFKQITLRETLDYVCQEADLKWELVGGVIVIDDK